MSARAAQRGRGVLVALAVLVLLAAAALGAGWLWLSDAYAAPGPAPEASRIEVAPGTSLRAVLAALEARGTVRNARAVEWYLRLKGVRVRVETGTYEIPPHASPRDILALFAEGRVVLEQLTVVEGATFAEFLEELAADPNVTHTLAGKSPAEVMAAIGHAGVAPEGQFFPDTYRFAAHTTDAAILTLAYDAMQSALAAAWAQRAPDLPLAGPYQALILASMIEKEAQLKTERARIAGVFVNRLRRGMRLQSDPTVIYGLGASYDGSIHTRDLTHDTPYNSYTRDGLPPTPIALPGRESLLAAVHPLASTELYFVATGLNDGAHHFSSTLEEHNQAVQTYLTRLRGQAHAPQNPSAGAHP